MRRGAHLALLLAGAATSVAAQEPTRRAVQLRIEVRTEIEGAELGHSVVSIPELGLERFVGAGAVVVLLVPPGPAHLVVKRLGYYPKDTTILVSDAPSQVVTIVLALLSVRLGAVQVADWPPCLDPGLPRADTDPVGRSVVEQLRQNAERYRLLERSYPFIYAFERSFGRRTLEGLEVVERTDTSASSSQPNWSYKPGTLVRVRRRALSRANDEYAMRIPSLRDISDPTFIANHCFHLAGIEDKGGQRLVRLDIVAAEALKEPDVNIAAWLDSADFRLRAATFHLTRIPPVLANLQRVTNEVFYLEVIPFVPVHYSITAERLEKDSNGAQRIHVERQLVLDVRFTGAVPDGVSQAPVPAPRRRRP